tara:strand:+ start:117 stop:536 length:420 start_codon:yes stop_codon:yes gene_type:complete
MGGSASDAVERLKPRSIKGVDIQTAGEGMAHVTRELDKTIGQEGLGGAIGRGMETINQGIAHNVKQVGLIGHGLGTLLTGGNPFDRGSGNQGPMTSEANYSQRAGTTGKTSGSKKKADMGDSKTKKSQRGKRALTVRNK